MLICCLLACRRECRGARPSGGNAVRRVCSLFSHRCIRGSLFERVVKHKLPCISDTHRCPLAHNIHNPHFCGSLDASSPPLVAEPKDGAISCTE
jgi:hypothetical protein